MFHVEHIADKIKLIKQKIAKVSSKNES